MDFIPPSEGRQIGLSPLDTIDSPGRFPLAHKRREFLLIGKILIVNLLRKIRVLSGAEVLQLLVVGPCNELSSI